MESVSNQESAEEDLEEEAVVDSAVRRDLTTIDLRKEIQTLVERKSR